MLNCLRSLAAGTLALCLLTVPSLAQQGLLTPGQVMGNGGVSNAVPRATSLISLFDGALCSTTGAFPVRTSTGWACSSVETVRVTDYGAVCNGVTDDRTSINNAITAAAALGAEVEFPPGTCIIGSGLTIPNTSNGVSLLKIRGSGIWSTLIKAKSSFSGTYMVTLAGQATFADIGISCNSQEIWGVRNNVAAINLPSFFDRVLFESCGTSSTGGFLNDGAEASYHIQNSYFISNYVGLYNADWGTDSVIENNYFLGGTIGIVLTNNGHSNEGIMVDNNLMSITGTSAIGIQVNKCIECRITKNTITGQPVGGQGIFVSGTGILHLKIFDNWIDRGINFAVDNQWMSIQRNTFADGSGITMTGSVAGGIADYQIIGNQFRNGASPGTAITLTKTANGYIAYNIMGDSSGAFSESGGIAGTIFVEHNIFAATCTVGVAILTFNYGGTGCTNTLAASATAVTITGNLAIGGTGLVTSGTWNGTKIGITYGGTNCTGRTAINNTIYIITVNDCVVAQTGTMSTARIWTLPAASTYAAGQRVVLTDESGTVTSTNTISVAPNGTDKIKGSNTTQVAINAAYGFVELESDGSSNWTPFRSDLSSPLGVTGIVPLANGGTNADLSGTVSNGGIFYSTASAGAILAGTPTARQMVQSGASGAPAWSTTTWPATTTINRLLWSSAANVISDLATANNGVLITSSGGVPSISSTIPNATQDNITRLGTVTNGTWNAGVIAGLYGGTGLSTAAIGDLIYASATTPAWSRLAAVATGSVLVSGGVNTAPAWSAAITVTTSVTTATLTGSTATVTPILAPASNSTTALQITKADKSTRIVDIDTTNARVGINKTPGAFDFDVNGAVNFGSTLTTASDITITTTQPNLYMNKSASGQQNVIWGQTNGLSRWVFLFGSPDAESGANAGSNWNLLRYDDAGNYIATVFTAVRSSGQFQINTDTNSSSTITGALVLSGTNAGMGMSGAMYAGGEISTATYAKIGTKIRAAGTAPALTSCGGASPAISGSDLAGEVTMGTTATGCVITFNVTYAAVPYCAVTWPAQALASQSYVVAADKITLTQTSTSNNKVYYVCAARSGG